MNNKKKLESIDILLYALAVYQTALASLINILTNDDKEKTCELYQRYMNKANEHVAQMPKNKVRKLLQSIEFSLLEEDNIQN